MSSQESKAKDTEGLFFSLFSADPAFLYMCTTTCFCYYAFLCTPLTAKQKSIGGGGPLPEEFFLDRYHTKAGWKEEGTISQVAGKQISVCESGACIYTELLSWFGMGMGGGGDEL